MKENIRLWGHWHKRRLEKKVRTQLYREILKNLEISHVMAQRGDFLAFLLAKWKKAQESSLVSADEQLRQYGQRLAAYNEAYADFIKYQDWYTKDIRHKTYDHAKVLHSKIEKMETQRQGLTDVIKAAGTGLKSHLV